MGDVKLRGFQRTYVRRVRLIQKHGEFAEHGTGSVTLAISTPSFRLRPRPL